MKKIISDNVIKFPFDNSIKVYVRGKTLTVDEELRQQKLMSNLKEAMFLYMELNGSFSDINGEYYTVESYFKIQCEKEKGSDPTFDVDVFADGEIKRIKSIIKQVKQLSDEPFYRQHPVYTQAKKYIKYLNKVINGRNIEGDPIIKIENPLSIPQIALIHVYKKERITRANADEIAVKRGYKSRTSGEGLFQDFEKYFSPANRKARTDPFTKKKMENKIDLFESVLVHLSDDGKLRADEDIKVLKMYYDEAFG